MAERDRIIKPILEHGQAVDIERENERQEAQDRIAELEKVNSDLRASLERSQTDMQKRRAEILQLRQRFNAADKAVGTGRCGTGGSQSTSSIAQAVQLGR